RRLIAKNSRGEEVSIIAIIKTQGSDTKLVAQMQPFGEAKGMQPRELKGKRVPPFAFQISDGENGGVMMNEFPGNYKGVWHENVLDPMNKLSAQFQAKLDSASVDRRSRAYRDALFHLLTAETSCYRYWGQGRWTDYAREICRRGSEILSHNFR